MFTLHKMFWFQTWKKWSKIKTKLSKFSKFVAFPTMFRFFSKKCSQISITFATMPCSSIAVARSISSVLGVEIPCISRLLPCATNGSVHYATIGSVHSGTPPPSPMKGDYLSQWASYRSSRDRVYTFFFLLFYYHSNFRVRSYSPHGTGNSDRTHHPLMKRLVYGLAYSCFLQITSFEKVLGTSLKWFFLFNFSLKF